MDRWSAVALRLVVGYGFIAHGIAKLLRGPDAFARILDGLHVPAPHAMAVATIAIELAGGAAILLGAFVRAASVPLAVVLLVAASTVHLQYGFSSIKLIAVTPAGPQFGPPGYEVALLYVACLAALVVGGPGPFSIDGLLARRRSTAARERPNVPGERLDSIPAGSARDEFVPLLLQADDSEPQVRSYYQRGELLVYRGADGAVRGVTLAIPGPSGSVELKAVAVAPPLQRRGVGLRMVAAVLGRLRGSGVRRVVVATASCAVGPLAFYQRAGFRLLSIERDVFTYEEGYPPGSLENGIPLRDRVWLDLEL